MKKVLLAMAVGLLCATTAHAVAPGPKLGYVHVSDLDCAPDHSCEVKRNESGYVSVYSAPGGQETDIVKAGQVVVPGDVYRGWVHVSFEWNCGTVYSTDLGALFCSYNGKTK